MPAVTHTTNMMQVHDFVSSNMPKSLVMGEQQTLQTHNIDISAHPPLSIAHGSHLVECAMRALPGVCKNTHQDSVTPSLMHSMVQCSLTLSLAHHDRVHVNSRWQKRHPRVQPRRISTVRRS